VQLLRVLSTVLFAAPSSAPPLERRADPVEIPAAVEPATRFERMEPPTFVAPSSTTSAADDDSAADERARIERRHDRASIAFLAPIPAGLLFVSLIEWIQMMGWNECDEYRPIERSGALGLVTRQHPTRTTLSPPCPDHFVDPSSALTFAGTIAASVLGGFGGAELGALRAMKSAPTGHARGTGRFVVGSLLVGAGAGLVVASVAVPEARAPACPDIDCVRRLAYIGAALLPVGALVAAIGSALIGHAVGERRARRRARNFAVAASGLGLAASGRF
jgi:hypothetical protein